MKSNPMQSSPMESGSAELITIGALAELFGVGTHVLRHWEAMGLLEPTERVNGRRRYGERDIARVALIQRGKAAGLSLQQMGELIAAPNPDVRRALLAQHRAELNRRVEELVASRALLDHALECQATDFTLCPAFRKLMHELREPVVDRRTALVGRRNATGTAGSARAAGSAGSAGMAGTAGFAGFAGTAGTAGFADGGDGGRDGAE